MSSELMRDVDPSAVQTILEKYGEIASGEYGGMYASRKKEVDAKIARLEESDEADFIEYASWAILDSARMNSYRGNYEDLHVMGTIAHRISGRRVESQGRDPGCRAHSLYHLAWVRAYRSQGHDYDAADDVCSCETT